MGTHEDMIKLIGVSKTFVMHLRDGVQLPVMSDIEFSVAAGQCVVLGGPSGIGKSSILKMIYGNYRTDRGEVLVRDTDRHGGEWIDVATASPRRVLELRQTTIGYVSQFLRTIPRVGALDIVTAAAETTGTDQATATARAETLLTRLNVPERLWGLAPATFSGGEQQRINIACGFAAARAVMLLDEPTASLDANNREVVVELINARKREGAAILGIFHDADVRDSVADCVVDVSLFSPKGVIHV